MPRGVYDRSKSKAEKSSAPAAKKSPIIKASAAKAVAKTLKAAPKAGKAKSAPATTTDPIKSDVGYAVQSFDTFGLFNVLGANIATLSQSFQQVASSAVLSKLIGDELAENVKALTALRSDVFVQKAEPQVTTPVIGEAESNVEAETEIEDTETTQAAAPVLPLATHTAAPTLPQGNASYTPPAPPTLPHPHH